MADTKKRKTSNGNTTDPKKKSRQDSPSEDPSKKIPQELAAVENPKAGTSRSNACDYIQIIVTGPQGCGRSSLVCSYMEQLFPPKGENFLSKQYLKVLPNKPPIMIWDLDARERFQEYRKKSYPEADVAFLCFDINKAPCGESGASALITSLRPWYEELDGSSNENVKIILVGLKNDLRNNKKFKEQNFFHESEMKFAMRTWPRLLQENPRQVSAYVDKDGVKALFEYAISIAEPQPKRMFATGGFEIVRQNN